MRLFLLALLLSILTNSTAYSQNWLGSAGINYGTYSMQSLKDFQKSIFINHIPFKVVESFPARMGFEMGLLHSFGKVSLGLSFSKASTGGRLSYADYSGSFNYDIITNNTIIGMQTESALIKKDKWQLFVSLRSGFSFNTMILKNLIQIGDQTDQSRQVFNSVNITLGPGVGSRIFFGHFFLSPEIRYESHVIKGNLYVNGQQNAYLLVGSKPAKMGWDGMRASLSIGYSL